MTDTRPPTAELDHAEGCPGAAVVERQTPRRRIVTCRSCGSSVSLARVNRWLDAGAGR